MEQFRLVLPKPMLAKLAGSGIYCQTWVTAERQTRADRWVLRAVESGGSTREIGRYIAFFSCGGARLPWVQKVDRIGANGVHAIAIADELLGVEIARVGQTYQLLIVQHNLEPGGPGKKPRVQSKVLFRGVDGQLSDTLQKQGLAPEFFARSGEVKPIPEQFVDAVKVVTTGVTCQHCKHVHGLVEEPPPSEGDPVVSIAS